MGKIFAVSNQKGGVGKSTTAINLSACLAELKKKVLVIDMDPQGNTTSGLGINKNEDIYTIYDLLIDEGTIEDCVSDTQYENLWILPSNSDLAAAEIDLMNVENKEYLLRDHIQGLKDDYDYIIIDCPPSLSLLTLNALCAALRF